MREPLKDKNRLEHMISAIDTILERTNGLSYDDFVSDKILFGGIVYHTMIIGEAAYKLSEAFVSAHPQVPWRDIADMRHHLVHGYYQVDPEIVWSVIQNDLLPLHEHVVGYINEIDWQEWEKNYKVVTETAVHKNLVQTARRMKNDGMDTQQIARYTGLTTEEIEEI